jgi:hypothetical protein
MTSTDTLWRRIVAPDTPDLHPAVAEYFLSLGFTPEEKERYLALAAKEHRDRTDEETAELNEFVQTNQMLMLFQAKARLSLKRHQPAA